jgi:flagellar operon protein
MEQVSRADRPVQFSAHAEHRLKSRGIDFDAEMMKRLSTAVDKAAQKGARDSLVMLQDLALIVSVKNRTVITAMQNGSMKENIVTNIDSAVIA